ncbi:bifunctional phosphoribosyl-AMP cyclohydrolase/phosphoribosyl-ATP diphosphatase HisIE [Paenibacillus mucilaginosus]|uniref:Histidine biosynthesis bifunctional protein HisIE n=3 Tax=Paenibacillus mucilaginosus TaxID=61624 RepID=H6NTL6_9BACL|nr:bifunctional phosphoribosyl-AMP cyclohydrolase/phosphoribosyl-ATP diphosphatase HisIE [Paenibacillus mucilaginosus]AEI38842.1 HisI [Paenibacillus mucilaginosus KNP414]AFC27163.1 HisI [Paenibacillus mucilaginosus 3016]AFH59304.1 phosphoribosyl-ATP pyrophosphatase [Paenibacillus mucilaginosus K02]MCG7217331.1 bifunctional phosphoribosyl-AMP cyclohydrolase/phosphoribosyl-ATP diphosphatase HisIE [Paenibacillus mucilaginosus]WDM27913.1 bifunctional phosphoribosyl-AMP cyclohydrolase/phosphoribosy
MSGAQGAVESIEALQAAVKWDAHGLVPAIVQDALSKEVLMMAYMNEESLKLTLESGETWFWSRSRQELWHKGATSGHTQKVTSLRYDCDGDTLLVLVEQKGPACHTGSYSCFFNDVKLGALAGAEAAAANESDRFAMLAKVEAVIAQRDAERPEGAYTTYLFEKGIDKILKKIGEEAGEVIIAAKNQDNDELRYEATDLLFHLMVLLRERKVPLDDLMFELGRRYNKPKSEYSLE